MAALTVKVINLALSHHLCSNTVDTCAVVHATYYWPRPTGRSPASPYNSMVFLHIVMLLSMRNTKSSQSLTAPFMLLFLQYTSFCTMYVAPLCEHLFTIAIFDTGCRDQAAERLPETETEESGIVPLARVARLRTQWHRYRQRWEDSLHLWLLCTNSNK